MNRSPKGFPLLSGAWPVLLTALIATAPNAFSQLTGFVPTIEAPRVQTSPVVNDPEANDVAVETFDELPHGNKPHGFHSSALGGTYSGGSIQVADVHGGAGGVGHYYQLSPRTNPPGVTLTLTTPQRYFGLWWSEAAAGNTITFLNRNTSTGVTRTLGNFSFENLNALVSQSAVAAEYRGNPNPNKTNTGHSLAHDYVFVNFYDFSPEPFNMVQFSNPDTELFNSDNHTIARSFGDIEGEGMLPGEIVPGPENGGSTDVGPGGDLENGGPVVVEPDGNLDVDEGGKVEGGGDITVDPGGMVTGDGTIMTPDLVNNGTVAPEGEEGTGTPGDLTNVGNYTQGPGGTLRIGIAGTQCPQGSRLVVTGTATLSGTLDLVSLSNFHAQSGSHYTPLIAFKGVSGSFSNIEDPVNTSNLTLAVVEAPNAVVVAFLPSGHGILQLRSAVPVPDNSPCNVDATLVGGLAPNASQLAAPLDIWFSSAQQQRFNLENHFDDLMAEPVEVPTPIVQTTKEAGKGVVSGKEEVPRPIPEKHWSLWASGYGDWVNIDSSGLAKGYGYTTGGFTAGLDYRIDDHYVIGLMGGYAHSWTDLKPGSIDLNSGWGGIYGGFYKHDFYVLGAVYGGGSSFDSSRATVFGDRANGSSNTQQWSTFLTLGYDIHFRQLTIGPLFAAQYSYANMDSFTEQGSIAALRVNQQSSESWRTDLGFRCWYGPVQIGKVGIRPFARVAWNHEYKESNLPVFVSLVDIPGSVAVPVSGPGLGHDSAVVNAGVSAQLTESISIYVSYDGQVGRTNFNYNGVSGGFSFSF